MIKVFYRLADQYKNRIGLLWLIAGVTLAAAVVSYYIMAGLAVLLGLIGIQAASLAYFISFFSQRLSETGKFNSSHMFVVMQEWLTGLCIVGINVLIPLFLLAYLIR